MNKSCKNCEYHQHENISDGYVCVNGDSDMCADWTEDDYCCDKWELGGCCENCIYHLILEKWTYIEDGSVLHQEVDGFVCMALRVENTAIHMAGIDPKYEMCEMYRRKDGE